MSAVEREDPTLEFGPPTSPCARCGAPLEPDDFACHECGLPVVPRMTSAWKGSRSRRPSPQAPRSEVVHRPAPIHVPRPAPVALAVPDERTRRAGLGPLRPAYDAPKAPPGTLTPRQRVVRAIPLGPAMEQRRLVRRAMIVAMHSLAVAGFVGLMVAAFLLGRLVP